MLCAYWVGDKTIMTRKLVSEQQLVSISDALKSSDTLGGDCRGCSVRGVYRLAEPDTEGCNWALGYFSGPPECRVAVAAVIQPIRTAYNLTS